MSNKVLIVDDEPSLLIALVDKFTRSGFTVIIAENGKEGLNAALKFHPDIILLDIIMPTMDGITMLNELRKSPWGKKVKVILLTNLAESPEITPSLLQRVCGYLVKSDWKIENVVKEVCKQLTDFQ